eukprot:TRINITY_DN33161_c0_g1_i1.p1 TRINITY_DN33161_c0_g1~~TRINITY_DN33161_c0_g1_i1.p1  ORF type:complete len:639 (+),score=101.22 TRINITY_DN33161_c0_g1_i1:108-1919(+)
MMPSQVKTVNNAETLIVADFTDSSGEEAAGPKHLPGTIYEEDAEEPSLPRRSAISKDDEAWADDKPERRPSFRQATAKLADVRREKAQMESPARLLGLPDPESIKSKIQEAIATEKASGEYNVFDFYWKEGWFQWIAKHPVFENTTLAVIAANAVYMAVETDWNKDRPLEAQPSRGLEDSPFPWYLMEQLFCAYFTLEWIIRFSAFINKCNCFRDAWFVFDSLLVIMMILETWIMAAVTASTGLTLEALGDTAILRLFRLLRLSRLLRMLKSRPELMILVRAMFAAVSSVGYVMFLLVAFTYAFAIAMTQLAVGTDVGDMYFANVSLSMYHLFIHATFMDDLAQFTNDMRKLDTWYLLALTLIFVCISSLTLMNMLVGVLCEVVSAVAVNERDENRARHVMTRMHRVLDSLDENADRQISYQEFVKMIEKPEALFCLKEVGVDPMQVIELADLFFFEGECALELTFAEFMDMVLTLRDSNTATVKDIIKLWNQIKTSQNARDKNLDIRINALESKVERTASSLSASIEETQSRLQRSIEDQSEVMRGYMATVIAEVQKNNPHPRYATDSPVVAIAGTVRRAGTSRVASKAPWDKVTKSELVDR